MNIPDQNPRHMVQENKSLIRGCNLIKKERTLSKIRPCFKIYVNPKADNINIKLTANYLPTVYVIL